MLTVDVDSRIVTGLTHGARHSSELSIGPEITVAFPHVATLARAWKIHRLATVATTVIELPIRRHCQLLGGRRNDLSGQWFPRHESSLQGLSFQRRLLPPINSARVDFLRRNGQVNYNIVQAGHLRIGQLARRAQHPLAKVSNCQPQQFGTP